MELLLTTCHLLFTGFSAREGSNSSVGTTKGITGTGGLAASPSALTNSTYFTGSAFLRSCSNSSKFLQPHSGGGRPEPRTMLGGGLTTG